MDIGDTGVTYLALPPNFHTEENNALCYATDRQLKKLMEAAGNISAWAGLKNTDAKYYDYMAASVRAPYYASQYNDTTRLGILESTFQVYMFAGTRKGVEELVSRVFSGEAVFVPWYGYNGTPYHFRISVHSSPVKDTHNKFKEILRRVKSARSVLDVVEYIISFIIHMPEEMDVTKIRLHTQLNFWGCDILNGTRLLDGSVLVDAKKRYNLVLGINNRLKFSISENIDADRVYIKILSCFIVHESINRLKAVFQLGCSGFWFPVNGNVPGGYNMPLKIAVPVKARVLNDMDITSLANGIIKACTEEKTGMALDLKASVNFWQDGRQPQDSKGQVLTAQTRHMAEAHVSERIGGVTITYRRNLCYLDGSGTLDGSRLVNAFYGKEDI